MYGNLYAVRLVSLNYVPVLIVQFYAKVSKACDHVFVVYVLINVSDLVHLGETFLQP